MVLVMLEMRVGGDGAHWLVMVTGRRRRIERANALGPPPTPVDHRKRSSGQALVWFGGCKDHAETSHPGPGGFNKAESNRCHSHQVAAGVCWRLQGPGQNLDLARAKHPDHCRCLTSPSEPHRKMSPGQAPGMLRRLQGPHERQGRNTLALEVSTGQCGRVPNGNFKKELVKDCRSGFGGFDALDRVPSGLAVAPKTQSRQSAPPQLCLI